MLIAGFDDDLRRGVRWSGLLHTLLLLWAIFGLPLLRFDYAPGGWHPTYATVEVLVLGDEDKPSAAPMAGVMDVGEAGTAAGQSPRQESRPGRTRTAESHQPNIAVGDADAVVSNESAEAVPERRSEADSTRSTASMAAPRPGHSARRAAPELIEGPMNHGSPRTGDLERMRLQASEARREPAPAPEAARRPETAPTGDAAQEQMARGIDAALPPLDASADRTSGGERQERTGEAFLPPGFVPLAALVEGGQPPQETTPLTAIAGRSELSPSPGPVGAPTPEFRSRSPGETPGDQIPPTREQPTSDIDREKRPAAPDASPGVHGIELARLGPPRAIPDPEAPPHGTIRQADPQTHQVFQPEQPHPVDGGRAPSDELPRLAALPPPGGAPTVAREYMAAPGTALPSQAAIEPLPGRAPIVEQPPMPPAADAPRSERVAWVLDQLPARDRVLMRWAGPIQIDPQAASDPNQVELFRRTQAAAQQGYPTAQFALAERYLLGRGVPADAARAEMWLKRAAELGYAPAQLVLGYRVGMGQGLTAPDPTEAYRWLSLAARRGNRAAQIGEPELERILAPEEAARARRDAQRIDQLVSTVRSEEASPGERRPIDTQLSEAAAQGSASAVQSMLARGADVNGTDRSGRTAMINAAWRGRPNIVDMLLTHGADTDFQDGEGKTPLIWAASNGHAEVAARLLDAGASVNLRDLEGRTALMRAAWNGHAEVVRKLLARGADATVRDGEGRTAADLAAMGRHSAVVDILRRAAGGAAPGARAQAARGVERTSAVR